MSSAYIGSVIVLMAIVTYLPRYLPLLLLAKYPLPRWFKTWLSFVPTAIFGALVFPEIFLQQGQFDVSVHNLNFWTTLILLPLTLKTRSLGLTIVAGTLIFSLFQLYPK
ncbi:MAG: AzlD domain-containing protein [Acidaminococcaceae bacterium]